jgi:hypothetical protein
MCGTLNDDHDRAELWMPSPKASARCDFIPRNPRLRPKPLWSICKINKCGKTPLDKGIPLEAVGLQLLDSSNLFLHNIHFGGIISPACLCCILEHTRFQEWSISGQT